MYANDPMANMPSEDRLPEPKGYKILIALPAMSEKTAGGLIYTDERREDERVAAIIGYVLKVGPDAYKDPERASEPWCKEGDWVIFRSYSGTRFKIDDQEFRLLNDDTIDAVIPSPEGYSRA